MGTFSNTSMGSGVFKHAGDDVGFVKDVKFTGEYDQEKLYTGVPQKLRGKITKQVNALLTAQFMEITTKNLGIALGGLVPQDVGGQVVNKAAQSLTFAAYQQGGLQAIFLDGPSVTNLFVKSADGQTVYTIGSDYIVDLTNGIVFRNPAGTIPAGAQCTLDYDYTPPTGKQLNLGSSFSIEQKQVEFVHTNPTSGKKLTIKFWLASVTAKPSLNFTDSGWLLLDVEYEAIFDETGHPENPLGTIHQEV